MNTSSLFRSFQSPQDEFTAFPFWFWNDKLSKTEIKRQINDFYDKGIKGFVIHPRKGLPKSIHYLSDKYMQYVLWAVREAHSLHMQVVLYDEAMYPSGSANGLVVKENPMWASRCLVMEYANEDVKEASDLVAVCTAKLSGGSVSNIEAVLPSQNRYICPKDGRVLLCFRMCFSGGTIRGVHEQEDDGEAYAPASADLLNPEAVKAFIRLTHEKYDEVLHSFFGNTVVAIFTDEPEIIGRNARQDCIAWTTGFLNEFGSGEELPALFLDMGKDTMAIRKRYRRAVNRRMLKTYYQPLSKWCEEHHVALTGHPAQSWDIGLLKPFQIPGQDVVWRYVEPGKGIFGKESVLAKCSADAAWHNGRRRNANECFGCCGGDDGQWSFDMDEMKWYMDYLFVRGVNMLFPHAFFYSLRDGRSDERPPDVGPNNLWWSMYRTIALYISRLSWLMTDVRHTALVAVLCQEDELPWRCCVPLYENQVEFRYVQASQLLTAPYTHLCLGDASLDDDEMKAVNAFCERGGKLLSTIEQLPRDAIVTPPSPFLRICHVNKEGIDLYLLVNEGETTIDGFLTVGVSGEAQWWNAWNGGVSKAVRDGKERYQLCLERRESIVLCVDTSKPPHIGTHSEKKKYTGCQVLANTMWLLTRMDNAEQVILQSDDKGCLNGWETIEGWAYYSGWVAYEATIDLHEISQLDLGDVKGMVRVFSNGKEVGTKMWAPYLFELEKGKHHLRIEVSNTMENHMGKHPLPSGIKQVNLIQTAFLDNSIVQ